MNTETKNDLLGQLYGEWATCTRCGLCEPKGRVRQNVVFGEGNPNASVMIIGEGPGEHEDLSGHPFWNARGAGKVFDLYLKSVTATREDVFIANVVGCRATDPDYPNRDRKPDKVEIAACLPRLHKLIEIVDPHVLLLLGVTALKALVKTRSSIKKIAQDELIPRQLAVSQGICAPVERIAYATFHPSYLARNWKMEEGSDAHLAWGTWHKAFEVADQFNLLYRGTEPPVRGEDD